MTSNRPHSPAVWICDVNGVLIDSTALVRQAFVATAIRYRFAFDEPDFQRIKGLWLLEAYRRLDPSGDPPSRRAFHLHYLRDRVADVQAFPGVRETLAAARAAGIRIGAATSQGEIAEGALVSTGLYPLIDCLVTQEEVRRPKPHPDALLRVLTLVPGDALHLGDTVEDIAAGKAAGVQTIGVTYGLSREAEIKAAAPDHIIHSFHEMRAWFEPRPSHHASGALA